MSERHITQEELAERMHTSQSRLGKILRHGIRLRVDDLDLLARGVGIGLVETVRDRGMEFHAEMTPTELRVLERIRQRPDVLQALLTLLDVSVVPTAKTTTPVFARRKAGRPKTSERHLVKHP